VHAEQLIDAQQARRARQIAHAHLTAVRGTYQGGAAGNAIHTTNEMKLAIANAHK